MQTVGVPNLIIAAMHVTARIIEAGFAVRSLLPHCSLPSLHRSLAEESNEILNSESFMFRQIFSGLCFLTAAVRVGRVATGSRAQAAIAYVRHSPANHSLKPDSNR
jgi:hypothetical protein